MPFHVHAGVAGSPLVNGHFILKSSSLGHKSMQLSPLPYNLMKFPLAKSTVKSAIQKVPKLSLRSANMAGSSIRKEEMEVSNGGREEAIKNAESNSQSDKDTRGSISRNTSSEDMNLSKQPDKSRNKTSEDMDLSKQQDKSSSSMKLPSSKRESKTDRILSGFASSERRSDSFRSQPGKNILEVLKESDKFQKRGKPVEPSDLFTDPKRSSKTEKAIEFKFEAPQLFVLVSFFLISSLMFGTVYIVWKLGAIHYNEF
eukprot:TRINITY_DN599_c0_g1_i1.p1 TRINITY_DN599_c0_g1~~TRINITY_DN599_c0_g1_i1.p1  ORF type:complete len:257 (-),score=38.59 TRINITY_DN599_c0_g1_i1:70-840(-)